MRGSGPRGPAPAGIGAPGRGGAATGAMGPRRLAGGERVAGPCFFRAHLPDPGDEGRAISISLVSGSFELATA